VTCCFQRGLLNRPHGVVLASLPLVIVCRSAHAHVGKAVIFHHLEIEKIAGRRSRLERESLVKLVEMRY